MAENSKALDPPTEGVEGVEALLQAVALLRLHRLSVIVEVNLEVGRLHEDEVSAGRAASVLACEKTRSLCTTRMSIIEE